MSEASKPFIERVILRNYKSIKECDVSLGPLTFLVGVNGSGKSNFLDALRFVAESLNMPMGQTLRVRGGFTEVCHRLSRHPKRFSIDLRLALPDRGRASFRFVVVEEQPSRFDIQEEKCSVYGSDGRMEAEYHVRNGDVKATFAPTPPSSTDRLYLTVASSFPEFRRVYDFLAGMQFYSINSQSMQETVSGPGDILMRDGKNAGAVHRQIGWRNPQTQDRIFQYLRVILPTLDGITVKSLEDYAEGHSPVVGQFVQDRVGNALFLWFSLHLGDKPVDFSAQGMSDGTLRAFGVLLALFQCLDRSAEAPIPLVGIEEPEATLHPAAAGVLMDALREASHFTQVLVTTHSPELLDTKHLAPESLLVVEAVEGRTVLAAADQASISLMRDRLYTAGELLKLNQLRPQDQPAEPVSTDTNKGDFSRFPDNQ